MIIVFVLTVFIAACGTLATSSTADCTEDFLACVVEKIQASGQEDKDDCQIGQQYANCTARALSDADHSGKCDPLTLLSYRHTQHQDISTYPAECPHFVVPAYLELQTDCERSLAHCGNSAIRASAARDDGDEVQTCRHLADLKECMEAIDSAVCPDQRRVNDLLQAEFSDDQYQATCVDTTKMMTTKKPSSTTTTTTTATKTSAAAEAVAITAETPPSQPRTTKRLPRLASPSTLLKGQAGDGQRNGGHSLTSDHCSQVILMGLAFLWCHSHM